ncbi:hypothetical protein K1T73_09745 [Roseovarius sp. SCSIO 43702]|uniref:hypothetical protein n=1 Tax=Roseovarius sp. SCSIO 43702 TaxID=2823043 RepID=UPI001C739BFE|nr:hypothetical protein [Roseovarius sp. SCSIO 43702]QYX55396.1 hypothetical protein K1T73_09745 [Roseovarius sp. SCSIO 43702]
MIFGLSALILFGGMAIAVIVLLPWFRAMIEIVLTGFLLADLSEPVWQDWAWIHDGNRSLVMCVVLLILSQLYCSPLLDRMLKLRHCTSKTRARTSLGAATVFHALAGTPAQAKHLLDADRTELFEHPDGDESRIRLIERLPGGARVEELYVILEEKWPLLRDFEWYLVRSEVHVPVSAGRNRLELVETPRGTVVLQSSTALLMPLRVALLQWIDDAQGRDLDQKLARLEKREWAEGGSSVVFA